MPQRPRPAAALAAFGTLLVLIAVAAKFVIHKPEPGEAGSESGTVSATGSQPSNGAASGSRSGSESGSPGATSENSPDKVNPGGKFKADPPRKLDPALDKAMDALHANSMAESYVQLLERGRTETSHEMETALVAAGTTGKEALGKVLDRLTMSDATRARVRSTYDSIH